MVIKRFDPKSGCYAFVEQQLQAAVHQHPATEVLLVRTGMAHVTINEFTTIIRKGCIIAPNVLHSIRTENAECEIWIIEKSQAVLAGLHSAFTELATIPLVVLDEGQVADFNTVLLEKIAEAVPHAPSMDHRIIDCIEFIREHITDQELSREMLSAHVFLSPSRLSHLFKQCTGSTLQNFIIWERLKYAILHSLTHETNLLNAAYLAGFFDAAHFSRAYLKMFGVNPSRGNNSSILQI